jgi:hypothetical protein
VRTGEPEGSERDLGGDERNEENEEITRVEGAGGEAEALRDLVTEDDHQAERDDRRRCVREERTERECVCDVGGRASEPRRQMHVIVDSVTKRTREMRERMEACTIEPAEDGGIGRACQIEEASREERQNTGRSREPESRRDSCHAPLYGPAVAFLPWAHFLAASGAANALWRRRFQGLR